MRKLLVLGGVAVIALIVGLWLVLANDDGAAAQTSSTTSPAPGGTSVGVPPPRGEPTVTTTERGERPELPATTSPEHPRDYVVGDIRVRDHRSGDNVPLDIPPNVHLETPAEIWPWQRRQQVEAVLADADGVTTPIVIASDPAM